MNGKLAACPRLGRRRAAGAIMCLLCLGTPALAQDGAGAPASAGTRSYTPQDFVRFAPRNGLDMLRQVPGFTIRQESQERGLGQATGNVLINGKRVSGKSNDAVTELGRVSASNVVRIDIVDGATLDVPGLSGEVANVITRTGGIKGQFSWRPEFRAHYADPRLTSGDISVSGAKGPVQYTIGIENNGFRGGGGGPTRIFGRDGAVIDVRDEVFTGNGEVPKLSGRFVLDGPGSSTANLNLSIEKFIYRYRERGKRQGPGLVDRERQVRVDEDSYSYEVGGDVEVALGGGRLKLIGLDRFEREPFVQGVVTSFADRSPSVGSRFATTGDSGERIGRAEYRWKSGKADWQISSEAAFNSLDNVSRLFTLLPDGEYAEVQLPGGSAKVTEDRYEVIASYGRPLSSKLSIQLSAGGEYSTLSQSGENGLTRSFLRPKGALSAAWKPTPRLGINAKLQRRVGQLDFSSFLASVNLSDDRENAGNPDLVPQQSWEAEVEATNSFGKWGSATLKVYGQRIDDIVDIVPIGETGESPGNIDTATLYGADFKGTFNFDPLGWAGAKLDVQFAAQRSRVEDPLTGIQRPISSSLLRRAGVSLRRDVPKTDWAYGGSAFYQRNAPYFRLTEFGRGSEGPVFASLFAEHKDVFGLTVRASAGNLLNARSRFDRTVFAGRRTDPIAFVERRNRLIGPIFSFSVRGNF